MTQISNEDRDALYARLDELNGLDSYCPSKTADEPTKIRARYLMACVTENETEIGLVVNGNPIEEIVIAAANYKDLMAANHPHALIVAALRAKIAVKRFMINNDNVAAYCASREIRPINERDYANFEAPKKFFRNKLTKDRKDALALTDNPDEWEEMMTQSVYELNDESLIFANIYKSLNHSELNIMARLLPCFASIVFQKTNHHYIDNEDYRIMYEKMFKGAQVEYLSNAFNKHRLIYDAVHWMGPYNMQNYYNNLLNSPQGLLPRGLYVRKNPMPAGTAVIGTLLAVFSAISAIPGTKNLMLTYDKDLKTLTEFKSKVMGNRLSYHVYAKLFNLQPLIDHPDTLKNIEIASKLCPIAQGFIEGVAQNSDLARARALKKHAEANLGLFVMAKAAFQGAMNRVRREAARSTVDDTLGAISKQSRPQITTGVEETRVVLLPEE